MKIYEVAIDISCVLQIEAENAKRAHKIINECLDLETIKTKDKEEYIEVIDWSIDDDVEIRVDNDSNTDEEWLICCDCNGHGCGHCKNLGDVRA